MAAVYILITILLALGIWAAWRHFIKLRRKTLLFKPLSSEQEAVLKEHVPLYSRLPQELRQNLQGCINYFLDEKVFVGADDLEITDEMRLIVAANACILIVNREKKYFPGFETIVIYPDTYVARQVSYDGLVEIHSDSTRAGESWHRGPIVLSHNDVMRGSTVENDGHNVVMHEFAHKLDEENGVMDGLPILRESADYKNWAKVLTQEYEAFLKRVDKNKNHVIDEYGAVSAPEFFAVATESFFEKSLQMKERLPELYAQLQKYYGMDPAAWE